MQNKQTPNSASNQKRKKSATEPTKQTLNARRWDEKHKVKPVNFSITEQMSKFFTDACREYGLTEKDVLSMLIKHFVDGKITIDFPKKKIKGVKVDIDIYQQLGEKCKAIAKEQDLEKTPTNSFVMNTLIEQFVKNPQKTIKAIPEFERFTPTALIKKIQEACKKNEGIPSNLDMEEPRAYTRVFGSWDASLYVAGAISYETYCSIRPETITKFTSRELKYVLYKRIIETNDHVDPNTNFPYPSQEMYNKYAWGFYAAYKAAKEMVKNGI